MSKVVEKLHSNKHISHSKLWNILHMVKFGAIEHLQTKIFTEYEQIADKEYRH